MKPKLDRRCDEVNKIMYSEASALRAVSAVPGARRYYFCDHCLSFHITSMSKEDAGIDDSRVPVPKKVSKRIVKKTIKKLKKKLGL